MKRNIYRLLRGNKAFRFSFRNQSLESSYNTFPIHLAWICFLWTIVMIQDEWNLIGSMCQFVIIIDLCIIAYRIGYTDMRRNLARHIYLEKSKGGLEK